MVNLQSLGIASESGGVNVSGPNADSKNPSNTSQDSILFSALFGQMQLASGNDKKLTPLSDQKIMTLEPELLQDDIQLNLQFQQQIPTQLEEQLSTELGSQLPDQFTGQIDVADEALNEIVNLDGVSLNVDSPEVTFSSLDKVDKVSLNEIENSEAINYTPENTIIAENTSKVILDSGLISSDFNAQKQGARIQAPSVSAVVGNLVPEKSKLPNQSTNEMKIDSKVTLHDVFDVDKQIQQSTQQPVLSKDVLQVKGAKAELFSQPLTITEDEVLDAPVLLQRTTNATPMTVKSMAVDTPILQNVNSQQTQPPVLMTPVNNAPQPVTNFSTTLASASVESLPSSFEVMDQLESESSLSLDRVSDAPLPLKTLSIKRPGWITGLSSNVSWMHKQEISHATVNVTPSELGPMSIHMTTMADQVNVTLVANHATTRDILDASMLKLREQLESAGFENVNVTVSQQQMQQHEQSANHGLRREYENNNGYNLSGDSSLTHQESTQVKVMAPKGLLDTFA